jgi:hypothetical protein
MSTQYPKPLQCLQKTSLVPPMKCFCFLQSLLVISGANWQLPNYMVFVAATCAVFSGVKSILLLGFWLQQQLLCFCCGPIQIKYNHQHSRLLLSMALWSRLELVGSWQQSIQLWSGNIEKWKVGKFEELKSSISPNKKLDYIYMYIHLWLQLIVIALELF